MTKRYYIAIKRLFDIFASIIGLIVTLPIWFVVIIGIEFSDPGPLFYIAKRVGKDNRVFKMFKFRSMRIDKNADENNFKADFNRIFPFGSFIRSSKIDELPQLINCLIGDMSIIGPRPASVDQKKITRGGIYDVVGTVIPGLSGPSALYDYIYGDTIEMEEEYERLVLPTRLELDRYYVNNASIEFDIKMIWWTVRCIFNSVLKRPSETILVKLKEYVEGEENGWK